MIPTSTATWVTGGYSIANRVATVALIAVALLLGGAVILGCWHGLDITDESFYLLWISHPFEFKSSGSQFGFVYHWLYAPFRGHVATMRIADRLLSFLLTWLVAYLSLAALRQGTGTASSKLTALVVALVVACGSFLVTSFELPQSPSYNTLSYQTLMVGLLALLLIRRSGPAPSFIGAGLLGAAGCLMFLAKPTTAAAFGLLCLTYLAVTEAISLWIIVTAGAAALAGLVIAALAIDASISGFWVRVARHVELTRLLTGDDKYALSKEWVVLPLSTGQWSRLLVALLLLVGLLTVARSKRKIGCALSAWLIPGFAILGVLPWLGLFSPARFDRFDGLILLVIPLAAISELLTTRDIFRIARPDWALIALVGLIPHAYAFGTGRPLWLNAEGAAAFWMLASVLAVWAGRENGRVEAAALLLASAALLGTSVFVRSSMEYPMRLTQPLLTSNEVVKLGDGGSLFVSPDSAEYIRQIQRAAKVGEFAPGTPVIDLTGYSPGVAYVLGGIPTGTPWFLGGYKGTDAYFDAVLDRVDCEKIVSAWIVTESAGQHGISPERLRKYGIDFKNDYQDVGSANVPNGVLLSAYEQKIWKPRRALGNAILSCQAAWNLRQAR